MAIAIGHQTKAAFRMSTNSSAAYPTTAAEAATLEQVLGGYDQIPYIQESLNEEFNLEMPKRLGDSSDKMDKMSVLGGGSIICEGMYNGLDNLIGGAMGWESNIAGSESPVYTESSTGLAASGTTVVPNTDADTIDATAAVFTDNNVIGEFIRIGTGLTVDDVEVRRIDTWTNNTEVDITPNFGVTPPTARGFKFGRAFTHLFECAPIMYGESGVVYGDGTWNRIRHGTLSIYKVVTYWNWRSVMVNNMSIRLTPEGMQFEFGLIPFDLDRTNAASQDYTTWDYSNSAHILQQKIRFGDCVFRIDDYSAATPLAAADKVAISEFTLNHNNNLKSDIRDTKSGFFRAEPLMDGKREVTGSFTLPRYAADTLIDKLKAETVLMADLIATRDLITGCSTAKNQMGIYIRSLQLTKHTENVAGAGVVQSKFEFRALKPAGNPHSMPAESTGSDNSEYMIQTVNSNPFNTLFDQNAEP